MTDREAIAAAMRAGSDAGRAGRPATECPYDVRSTDPRERLLVTLWLRGHRRHVPFPLDTTS